MPPACLCHLPAAPQVSDQGSEGPQRRKDQVLRTGPRGRPRRALSLTEEKTRKCSCRRQAPQGARGGDASPAPAAAARGHPEGHGRLLFLSPGPGGGGRAGSEPAATTTQGKPADRWADVRSGYRQGAETDQGKAHPEPPSRAGLPYKGLHAELAHPPGSGDMTLLSGSPNAASGPAPAVPARCPSDKGGLSPGALPPGACTHRFRPPSSLPPGSPKARRQEGAGHRGHQRQLVHRCCISRTHRYSGLFHRVLSTQGN